MATPITTNASPMQTALRSASRLGNAARVRVLSAFISQLRNRLVQTAQKQQQAQNQRRVGLKRVKIVKPTFIFFMMFLIVIAGFVDIVDYFKEAIAEIPIVGWAVNILVGIVKAIALSVPSYFLARRIKRINKSAERIAKYGQELYRQAKTGLQRVTPLARELGWTTRLPAGNPDSEFASLKQFILYEGRILLNQALVALLEGLPLTDLGPWQTVRLIRIYRDQQLEYRKAKAALATCQLLINKIGIQDKIELDYLSFYILLAQQLLSQAMQRLSREQQEEFVRSQQTAPASFAPQFAT